MIHHDMISRFGGTLGVRDFGALESAIGRPQSGYYDDLIQAAAALLESLSQNHPFLDGNKRTAITLTSAFLSANGYELDFTDLEAYRFLIDLYNAGQFRLEHLEKWLRQHARASSNAE